MNDVAKGRAIDEALVAESGSASELAVSLLASLPDCVKLLDLDGHLDQMSFAGLCLMEIDDFSSVRGRPWWALWPEESSDALRRAVAVARDGGVTRLTAFCPTAKGTPKWWDVSVSPVRNGAGRVTGILSVSRDVTPHLDARHEAEAALERTKLLLREIDHRVKNSLMLIVSLLRMQTRQVADPAAVAALGEAAQRVRTVARVHDRLYRAESPSRVDLDDYLRHLCRDLDGAFRHVAAQGTRLDLDALSVDPDLAVALGLVTAELVANAYRHAGLGSEVEVTVSLRADGAGRAVLTVADDGRGLPRDFAPERASGVGMRVVLAKCLEMDGTLTHGANPEGGARFEVAFPVA